MIQSRHLLRGIRLSFAPKTKGYHREDAYRRFSVRRCWKNVHEDEGAVFIVKDVYETLDKQNPMG